jgi:hypothetical protein
MRGTKKYLFGSIMAFVLSAYGLAGMLPGMGQSTAPPVRSGAMLFIIGCIELYWYRKSR